MIDKTIACADGVIEFLGLFGLVYVFANFGLESGMDRFLRELWEHTCINISIISIPNE